jgi:pSer/pThr/pTyr-binding forkhead associated (FHA) protein
MEKLIRDKFRRNQVLRSRLSETGSSLLQNSYPDNSNPSNTFWGTVNERGENQVGKILMKIRSDIEKDSELENWLLQTFDLITDVAEMPRIILHEYKNQERLKKTYLEDKRFYIIGSALDCDLKFTHDSIEAYHAALLVDRSLGLVLIDLNSSVGTFVNESRIRKSIPAPLEVDDWITFGEKRKKFRVEVYVEHIKREYERRIREIEKELQTLENMQNPGNDLEKIKKNLQVSRGKIVKIENLAKKTCCEEEILEIFSGLGEIKSVRVFSRKFEAFLEFSSEKAAESAVKWDGMTVQGRRLRIFYSRERSRSR